MVLEQRQDPAEALAGVDTALATCPLLTEARVDRGRALLRLDRNADAGDAQTHFLLAQALRGAGRAQEAQSEMQLYSKLEESARAKSAERAKQILQEKEKSP